MLVTARPQPDRDAILRLASDGDEEAFAAIVREHQSMVYSLAKHLLQDAAAAEEVGQDVFLQLYKAIDRIQLADHLLFWLRRVAMHRAVDAARRRGFRRTVPLDEAVEPFDLARHRDPFLRRYVSRLLRALPAKTRALVVLRYQEDLEPAEIAALLGMRVNTVKSQLQRALASLRRSADGRRLTGETPDESTTEPAETK